MIIGNIQIATLGHGINDDIIIAHPFFGTERVINNLKESPNYENGLIILQSNSLIRDDTTGLVCGIQL